MSAHRRNYTPDPVATKRDALYIGIPLLAVIVAAGLTVFGFAGAFTGAKVTPIPVPTIVERPVPALGAIEPTLDTQRLIELRTEAFRAGLQEGLGRACGVQPLLTPIGR
jgi:hypothetical protein